MCGIIGVVANASISQREWLRQGRDAMTHRGPDDAGEWWSNDGHIGLAQMTLPPKTQPQEEGVFFSNKKSRRMVHEKIAVYRRTDHWNSQCA